MGAVDPEGSESDLPKALNTDTVWLARFGDRDWRHQLNRAAQRHKFNATLSPRLDRAIEEWHETQPPAIPPPIIDLENLHIRAPWTDDESASSPD